MHPPIVYLDTQDYSNLTDAINGRGQEHLRPVYDQLLKFSKEGHFRFCFSYMIVGELLQLSPESIDIARRKAVLVEELCGGSAFPSVFWMLGSDIAEAAERRGFAMTRQRPSLQEVTFSGQWIRVELPPPEEMFANFDQGIALELEKLVRDKLGRPLNRNERRRTARTSTDKIAARRIVREAEFFPIIEGTELVDTFTRMLLGKCRRDTAYESFFRLVGTPTKLILAHENISPLKFLNDQLETLKTTMLTSMTRLRDATDEFQVPNDPASRAIFDKQLNDGALGMLLAATQGAKRQAVRCGVPETFVEGGEYEKDVQILRLAPLWQDLLTLYFKEVVNKSPTRRTLLKSDFVDFLHALYIPHCAVWRSDKYFAKLATPVAKRFGCRVVSRLVDLPRILNEILIADKAAKLSPETPAQ